MKKHELDLDAEIHGIYLSTEMIDLMSIIQSKSMRELQDFVQNCEQLKGKSYLFKEDGKDNLEQLKKEIFEDYQSILVSTEQSVINRKKVIENSLRHSGIEENKIQEYIKTFSEDGLEVLKIKLQQEHPDEYSEMAKANHRFIASERDQIKDVTYEEIEGLTSQLRNHDTILIGSGRYYDVVNKLSNDNVPELEKYDFYHMRRALDFCERNGMQARYHTLLDKQTLDGHLAGKDKETVLAELRSYVKESIDFINEYNQNHKIKGRDGKDSGIIKSVDLFNEIISFDPPYVNRWEQEYGISLEELMSVFQYAKEHKPDGVTYVYNEPFLEDDERRKAVIGLLEKMPDGLIDTLRNTNAYRVKY